MNEELKKLIATALSTGAIVSSAVYGIAKPECDFVIQDKGKDVCVSKELKEVVKQQLPISSGFGGIRFGGE